MIESFTVAIDPTLRNCTTFFGAEKNAALNGVAWLQIGIQGRMRALLVTGSLEKRCTIKGSLLLLTYRQFFPLANTRFCTTLSLLYNLIIISTG
jgi:hypothetical protein